jgi:hypothetical protein
MLAAGGISTTGFCLDMFILCVCVCVRACASHPVETNNATRQTTANSYGMPRTRACSSVLRTKLSEVVTFVAGF